MKNNILTLAAAALITGAAALTSCGGGEPTSAVGKDGVTVTLPKGIHYYKAGERKAKVQPTAEKLSFDKSLADVKGQVWLNDKEFQGNQSLKEVYFLHHVTNIAPYAFEGCTNLEKVKGIDMIDVVNDNAFENCTSLKTFDAECRTVGLSSFANCTSLEEFITTDNFFWVRDSAFLNCTSLKKVILGIAMSKFEDTAFEGCEAVEEISVPSAWRRHMFNVYKTMPNLQKVYLLVMEHFAFPESSAEFPCEQVSLYVPDVFLAKYQGDASWSRFKEILPLSQSEWFTDMGTRK